MCSVKRLNELEKSGALQGIFSDPETNKIRPLLDEDIRNAIESLNTSTAAIQKQTEILKSQCENLNKCLGSKGERALAQKRESERLRQKHEWAKQSIKNAVMNPIGLGNDAQLLRFCIVE